MNPVKNSKGKLVCMIDESTRTIEIVQNGIKTLIKLTLNGKFIISNYNLKT